MNIQTRNIVTAVVFSLLVNIGFAANAAEQDNDIKYKTVEIDDQNILYREAANPQQTYSIAVTWISNIERMGGRTTKFTRPQQHILTIVI